MPATQSVVDRPLKVVRDYREWGAHGQVKWQDFCQNCAGIIDSGRCPISRRWSVCPGRTREQLLSGPGLMSAEHDSSDRCSRRALYYWDRSFPIRIPFTEVSIPNYRRATCRYWRWRLT